MKSLLLGIVLIVIVGIGGLVYRNAVEHPARLAGCTLEAKVCPDGTAVGRSGPTCSFAECAPPNVSLEAAELAYALPSGFTPTMLPDKASLAVYETVSTTNEPDSIIVRRYLIAASSTALDTIKQTAIGGVSGEPVSTTAYSSTIIGGRRFTVVSIERFEAVVDTAYYLARTNDVLRFDAIDRDVPTWTDPGLDVSTLPAATALRTLLATLQSGS